jgi:hypothetical protein
VSVAVAGATARWQRRDGVGGGHGHDRATATATPRNAIPQRPTATPTTTRLPLTTKKRTSTCLRYRSVTLACLSVTLSSMAFSRATELGCLVAVGRVEALPMGDWLLLSYTLMASAGWYCDVSVTEKQMSGSPPRDVSRRPMYL